MKRGGYLKRRRPLRRWTPIAKVNRQRAAQRRRRDFGELADYVRGLPCCVPGCRAGDVQAAHVRSRGAGGHAWIYVTACHGPTGEGVRTRERVGNLVPLCRAHHCEQHGRGIQTFQAAHGLDLAAVARKVGEDFGGRS